MRYARRLNELCGVDSMKTTLDRLGLHDQRLRRAAKRLVAADARQRDGELFMTSSSEAPRCCSRVERGVP